MTFVFVLHHIHADDEHADDAKLIGTYSSQDSAQAAIERLKNQPGFRDHVAGFEVNAYELDVDHWQEGFISWDEANEPAYNEIDNAKD